LQIFQKLRASELNTERLRLTGHTFSAIAYPDGTATIEYILSQKTTPAGTFAFEVPFLGDVEMHIAAPGHLPAQVKLGPVLSDFGDVNVKLPAAEGARRVTVRWGERRFPGTNFMIVDITNAARQFLMEEELDKESSVAADWLEVGREYWLVVRLTSEDGSTTHLSGMIRWDNRADVDLSSLEQNLGEFKERQR
jgi:hypothetical protein